MQDVAYLDLKTREQETMFFFAFNAFLCSRLDTDQDSDGDEEVNVYMAHLLLSLVDGRFYTEHAEVLGSTPAEVFAKAEQEDTPRHKLQVYRANADHRLVSFGLFSGSGERQSLYRQTFANPAGYLEEAQQYYHWAALFGNRLPARYQGLALALAKIATNFETYCAVLTHLSTTYLRLMPRLSSGEVFHLEREAHQAAQPYIREEALNRLLDAYNHWQTQKTPEARRRFQDECALYQQVNPVFDPSCLKGEVAA
jgi:hypothetical protein